MIFGSAVLGLLGLSLWLRATMPTLGEPAVTATRTSSVVVLPFVNTNPDSLDNYLGYGVATEVTRALRELPGLKVASRSSAFADWRRSRDRRAVGRQLNVSTVLEGSFRRDGDRLRVTAHLVDVREGFDLWSDTYERAVADLPAIQREIKHAIARAFRITVIDSGPPVRRPEDFAAYDAYLLGTYLLEQSGSYAAREAIAQLNRAIRLDSGFARAHAALADAYLPVRELEALPPRVAMPRAEAAALKALQLDSTLAGPHVILGEIRLGYNRNWRAAEAEFRRAITADPGMPEAHRSYSRFLTAMARFDESLTESQAALRLSPAAPRFIAHLGWHYLHARQFVQARETLLRAVQLDSISWRPQVHLALVEQATGNYDAALRRLEVPLRYAPERPEVRVALGQVYALNGRIEEARTLLHQLQEASRQGYVPAYLIACLQASLGQRRQAFNSLDRAVRERSELVPFLRVDPRLDSLRNDRRFTVLLRQLRLP
jgi:adenylate cyclase